MTTSTTQDTTASTAPSEGPGTPPAARSKLIKRYSNRKLYDTARSRYVTLDEIARMIKSGEEVTVIDNESKEDLTSVTLTQIIYEEEKRESRMPLSMLRNLIQTGGHTLHDFFDRSVKTPVVEIADNAQKSVGEVLQSAAQIRDAAISRVDGLTDSARRIFAREERRAEEFQRAITGLLEETEQRLAERIGELRGTSGDPDRPDDASGVPEEAARRATLEAHTALLRERLERLRSMVEDLGKLGR